MYKGPRMIADSIPLGKRVLILGESHYLDKEEDRELSTTQIVDKYMEELSFFFRIAKVFNYERNECLAFYNKIYFGNYIDIPVKKTYGRDSGISDVSAKDYLTVKDNCVRCNDALFRFVNENKIDIIVCVCKSVYGKLPGLATSTEKIKDNIHYGSKMIPASKFKFEYCFYENGVDHKGCSVRLSKVLQVYALPHPTSSRGYYPLEEIKNMLKGTGEFDHIMKP